MSPSETVSLFWHVHFLDILYLSLRSARKFCWNYVATHELCPLTKLWGTTIHAKQVITNITAVTLYSGTAVIKPEWTYHTINFICQTQVIGSAEAEVNMASSLFQSLHQVFHVPYFCSHITRTWHHEVQRPCYDKDMTELTANLRQQITGNWGKLFDNADGEDHMKQVALLPSCHGVYKQSRLTGQPGGGVR
jgi:hypothetical protein